MALLLVGVVVVAAAVAFVIGKSGSGDGSQPAASDEVASGSAGSGTPSVGDGDAPANAGGAGSTEPDSGTARPDGPGEATAVAPTDDAATDDARLDAGAPDAADRRRGMISIDSNPYATIYVDGRRIGVTPIIAYKVRPGRRRIKAVTASGETKRFTISVRPGKRARAKRLTW